MTDTQPNFGQTLIVVLPSILAFLTASLAAVLAYLAKRGNGIVATKVEELHLVVNSRLDALVEMARQSARAEGIIAGIKEERARPGSDAVTIAALVMDEAAKAARVIKNDAVTAAALVKDTAATAGADLASTPTK